MPPAVDPAAVLGGLAVSTGDLVPAFDPATTEYTLSANTSLFPLDVTATADPALAVTVQSAKATAGVATTLQLAPRQDLVVTVASGSASKTYTVHYLPPDFPAYTVSTIDPAKAGTERILLTPDDRWLLVVNRAGDPLYYRFLGSGYPSGIVAVADFEEHFLPDNTPVYTCITADGIAHVMDNRFRETSATRLLPNGVHGDLSADIHDFLVLDREHYVVMSYYRHPVDLASLDPAWADGAPIDEAVVQEIDHGAVTFEWSSSSVPSLYFDSVDGNAFAAGATSDYVHMNSLQIDPFDGNLIVSLRHTNSILKLDRKTGATLWTLGGRSDDFGLPAEQLFSHQHHARMLADGTMLIFDNGNNAHPTRVIELALDETNKTVKSFAVVVERAAEQPDTAFMGSAFRFGQGRYLVGWGGHAATAPGGPAVTETVGGATVWSLTFTSPSIWSYRAAPMLAP